jgi:hypothetical protein
MDVSSLINAPSQAAQGSGVVQSDSGVGGNIDPASPSPVVSASTEDTYHSLEDAGTSSLLTGQTGVSAYTSVTKVTDMTALTQQWLGLISTGLGNPSGALRGDYQAAIAKLSPTLQQKDWGFSVNNGQLVFTQGKDELSTQDLQALQNAFAGTNAAADARHIANATVAMVSVAQQMMPDSSSGIGSYSVTAGNFSDVVDLRTYLMSHSAGGQYGQNRVDKSDYSDMYQITGMYAVFDQIAAKAPHDG